MAADNLALQAASPRARSHGSDDSDSDGGRAGKAATMVAGIGKRVVKMMLDTDTESDGEGEVRSPPPVLPEESAREVASRGRRRKIWLRWGDHLPSHNPNARSNEKMP